MATDGPMMETGTQIYTVDNVEGLLKGAKPPMDLWGQGHKLFNLGLYPISLP